MTPQPLRRPKPVDRAFDRLYRRHVHEVYRYTLAVLRHEADAEDITQATFLSAYRAFRKGERPVKPHNWLIKIAHNECRQRFRASARRPQEVALHETDSGAAVAPADDVPTAEELRHALAQLSFNQRAALVMRELEGRSYAEIGAILETSVSAVETLLFRARRALREQLEGALTCGEAELALARRLDATITASERGPLRAHLRECKECAALERRQRAHRAALKATLGAVPLPASLQSFFGGGTATATGGVALAGSGAVGKVAAVVAAGAVAVGAGPALEGVASKPDARQADVVAGSPDSAKTKATWRRSLERPTRPTVRPAQPRKRPTRTVAFEPAGNGAAHRRSLRRSDLEPAGDASQAPAPFEASTARTEPTPGGAAAPPAPAPPPASPIAPLPVPDVPVPLPPPPAELSKPPALPPPPPAELPKLPLLPPPPPLPPLPPPPVLP